MHETSSLKSFLDTLCRLIGTFFLSLQAQSSCSRSLRAFGPLELLLQCLCKKRQGIPRRSESYAMAASRFRCDSDVLMFPRFSVARPSLLFHFFTSMDSSSICRIRDTYRAIIAFEAYVEEHYDLNLNEAMLLCALSERTQMTAGEVAEALGLTHSNTSKVIASAERQRLIKRRMDKDDKRRMFFTLTPGGEERLATLKSDTMELPELLR